MGLSNTASKMADSNKLPGVPETLLKRRKTLEKVKAARAAAKLTQKKSLKDKRKIIFKRAEAYVKEYRAKERDEIRFKRMAKSHGNFYVPAQARLAFVIRIRGVNQVSPKDAEIGRTICCLGVPKSEERQGVDHEARI